MRIRLLFPCLFIFTLAIYPIRAGMIMMDRITFDFTDFAKAARIAKWDDSSHLLVTKDGLGFDGDPKSSRDTCILLQPIAVGHGWRPAGGVGVKVTLNWDGDPGYYYSAFLRFSPDGEHWSTWQTIPQVHHANHDKLKQKPYEFATQVTVPRKEQTKYQEKRRGYAKLDVPWVDDEHAMCEWIVKNEPDFFKTNLPFAGYIQVMIEGGIRGSIRLKSIQVDATSSTSGLHRAPSNPAAEKLREGLWNYWTLKKSEKNPKSGFHQAYQRENP